MSSEVLNDEERRGEGRVGEREGNGLYTEWEAGKGQSGFNSQSVRKDMDCARNYLRIHRNLRPSTSPKPLPHHTSPQKCTAFPLSTITVLVAPYFTLIFPCLLCLRAVRTVSKRLRGKLDSFLRFRLPSADDVRYSRAKFSKR